MSVLFLAASFFLAACTDEETVEVPGPTVTTTVPGPTVTVPTDIPSTDDADVLSGSNADDTIDGKGGNDEITGGDGDDMLMGGEGNDEISGGLITEYTYADDNNNPPNLIATKVDGCARGANADGMDGDDTIRGGDGNDSLYGGSDDDTIYGEGGDDLACGNSGNDMLDGGAGDDHLDGGAGDDTIVGGDGNDLVDYSSSPQPITVDLSKPGNIIQDGFYGRDTISGIERIKGSAHADTLTGGDSPNTFLPGAGADVLDGGAGKDTLDYSDSTVGVTISLTPDSCTAAPATKTIITVNDTNNSNSPAHGDKITAPNTKGADGNPVCLSSIENITGSDSGDNLTGDSQDNVLTGGPGGDTLNGGPGDDTLNGGLGGDALNGGAGDDTLNGGAGNNTYTGGAGDDMYYVTDTSDQGVQGTIEQSNEGTDTVSFAMYEAQTAPTATVFTYTLAANIENVIGSKYSDSLTGNDLANKIDGGAGDDTLRGGGGNDIFVIMAGEGNDNIADADSDSDNNNKDMIQFKGFGAGTTASYREVSGGFLISVGNQSTQVTTSLSQENLEKIVTVQ